MNLFAPIIAVANFFQSTRASASATKRSSVEAWRHWTKVLTGFKRQLRIQKAVADDYFAHHEMPQAAKSRWQHFVNAYDDMVWRDDALRSRLAFLGRLLSVFFAWDILSNTVFIPLRIALLGAPAGWEVKLYSWMHGAADTGSKLASAASMEQGVASLGASMGFIERYLPLLGIGAFFLILLGSLAMSFAPSQRRVARSSSAKGQLWWMRSRFAKFGIMAVGHAAAAAAWIAKPITGHSTLAGWVEARFGMDDRGAEAFWRVIFPGTSDADSLKRAALRRYPATAHPSLYISNIPIEVKRPMVVYGTAITGEDPGTLFKGSVSPREAAGATRVGIATFLAYLAGGLLAYHPNLYFNWMRLFTSQAASHQAAKIQSSMGMGVSDSIAMASSQINSTLSTVFAGHGWLTALALALFMGHLAARRVLRDSIESAPLKSANLYRTEDGPLYYTQTQEQMRLFKSNEKKIVESERDMANAVAKIKRQGESPLWAIGYSTGELLAAGRIGGALKGTPIGMDLNDMCQNTLITGGTGAGKTYLILKPLMTTFLGMMQWYGERNQRLTSKALNLDCFEPPKAYREQISMLLMDGKADLHNFMKTKVEGFNQKGRYKVIGLNSHEWVIDILDGLPPQLVSTFFKSLASQMGASSTESFWPDQAAIFIERFARVAQAFDVTDGGLEWRALTKVRPYSVRFIYELLKDMTGEKLAHCAKAILHCMETEPLLLDEKGIDIDNLMEAIRELNDQWINDPAETTKSNIRSNLDNMLKPIVSDSALSKTFAAGNGPQGQFMKVTDFWGSIVATNITGADGAGGAMILTLIKTRFMYEALKRSREFDERVKEIERAFMKEDWFMKTLDQVLPGLCREAAANVGRRDKAFDGTASEFQTRSMERELRVYRELPGLMPAFLPVYFEAHRIATARAKHLAKAGQLEMPINYDNSIEQVFLLIASLRRLHEKAVANFLPEGIKAAAAIPAAELAVFDRYESMMMSSTLGKAMFHARRLADAKLSALRARKWGDEFAEDEHSAQDFMREAPSRVVARELEAVRDYYDTPQARLQDVIASLRSLNDRVGKRSAGLDGEQGFDIELSDADRALAELTDEEAAAFSNYESVTGSSSGDTSVSDLAKFSLNDVMGFPGGEELFTSFLQGNPEMLRLYYEWRDLGGLERRGVKPRLQRERIANIIDESQEVLTVDKSASAKYTDSGFWNVSRSAGVMGFLCTQTISTYYKTIGNEHLVNAMLEQMRTKICAASDDQVLFKMFKEVAGTIKREEPRTGSKKREFNRDLTFVNRMIARNTAGKPEFSLDGVAPIKVNNRAGESLVGSWDLGDAFASPRNTLNMGVGVEEQLSDYDFAGEIHTSHAGGNRQSNEDTVRSQHQQAKDAAKANYDKYIDRDIKEEDAFDAGLFRNKSEGRFTVSVMRGNRAVFEYIDVNTATHA